MEPFIEYNTIETIRTLPFFTHKTLRSVTPLLSREYGNTVVRVETSDGRYVVRRLKRGETDGQVEDRVGRLAHAAGIAPEIVCYDDELSLMIMAYVAGEHRTKLDDTEIIHLGRTLRKLHNIPYQDVPLPSIDLRRIIEPDREEIGEAFATVERFAPQLALCHHDLTPNNILWNGHDPIVIDFEYAGIADACFDLAAVCVEFELDGTEREALIGSYFDNSTACPREKLLAWEALYRALRRQWLAQHGIDQIP